MAARPRSLLRAFRIADIRHPIFDGSGAMFHGVGWNSAGRRVIYAAETYAGALLEVLVQPFRQCPGDPRISKSRFLPDWPSKRSRRRGLPGWDSVSYETTRKFSDRWYAQGRTVVLIGGNAGGAKRSDESGRSGFRPTPRKPAAAGALGCAALEQGVNQKLSFNPKRNWRAPADSDEMIPSDELPAVALGLAN